MSQRMDPSPDEALLHFVERLPATIRPIVLARCCLAFDRLQLERRQDLFATFRSIVRTPRDRAARAYTCAKMIAVIELTLHGDCADRVESARELAGNAEPDPPGSLDLQASLIQKHWRAAREEFAALRTDVLSIDALHGMLAGAPAWWQSAGTAR